MDYPKEFFDVQVRFAEKVAALSQCSLNETIGNYTACYPLFNLGTNFDWEHPVWKNYLAGLNQADDIGEWTYQVYCLQREKGSVAHEQNQFGCFAYDYHGGDRRIIRLHFNNRDASGEGPLSHQRQFARMDELRAMFRDIQNTTPKAKVVRGETWLYNRPQYTRLFPPKYGESAQVGEAWFQFRGIWGQFVKSNGQIQEPLATSFLQNIARQQDMHNLEQCFPLQALRVECEIAAFYAFYGI